MFNLEFLVAIEAGVANVDRFETGTVGNAEGSSLLCIGNEAVLLDCEDSEAGERAEPKFCHQAAASLCNGELLHKV